MIHKGVEKYQYVTATIEWGFPEGEYIRCQKCRYCYDDKDYRGRQKCVLTNKQIFEPKDGVEEHCPMKLKEEAGC